MMQNSMQLDGCPTRTHNGPQPLESLFSAGMKAGSQHFMGLCVPHVHMCTVCVHHVCTWPVCMCVCPRRCIPQGEAKWPYFTL